MDGSSCGLKDIDSTKREIQVRVGCGVRRGAQWGFGCGVCPGACLDLGCPRAPLYGLATIPPASATEPIKGSMFRPKVTEMVTDPSC